MKSIPGRQKYMNKGLDVGVGEMFEEWEEVSVTGVEWGVGERIVASGTLQVIPNTLVLLWVGNLFEDVVWRKKAQPISWELYFIQWTF